MFFLDFSLYNYELFSQIFMIDEMMLKLTSQKSTIQTW